MRNEIYKLIENIKPNDPIEAKQKKKTLAWIASGAEIFRAHKSNIPKKHFAAYFVLLDIKKEKILLVDHKKAGRWIPGGGHIEPNEHPRETIDREIVEEFGISARYLLPDPIFVSVTNTPEGDTHHTDVTLWYLLAGDSQAKLNYDTREFHDARWFSFDKTPDNAQQPNLLRFLAKLKKLLGDNKI